MDKTRNDAEALGSKGSWGSVAYTGTAFAPSDRTYAGVNSRVLNYTHRADSGDYPAAFSRGQLANLVPLILSAMWEASFVKEAGVLSTWGN